MGQMGFGMAEGSFRVFFIIALFSRFVNESCARIGESGGYYEKITGDEDLKRIIFALLLAFALTTGAKAAPDKYVALTFDDGPSGDNTLALMQMLEEQEVKATFFLCGYRMEIYPDLVRALSRAGHELGVHGYSHTCFDVLCREELRKELQGTAQQIRDFGGVDPVLLRPPCGAWNEAVRESARAAGMTMILWSADSLDWQRGDVQAMAARVCSKAKNGDIILLHDMYPDSIEAAKIMIGQLRAQGFAFVTVSELAGLAQCSMEPGDVFSQFSGAQPPEEK